MKKAVQENLEKLARQIWDHGQIKNGAGCLMPSEFHFGDNDDPIIDTYDVTHYDRQWKETGKYVTINLYKAECFGACQKEGELKHSFVVEV
ncbi:MAG: hypothetical protein EOM23_06710 [Candidatus Moranbacteria bacterium]|nr:hypothetical protein [Candidatus Moranbacteria bacterium]